MVHGSSGWMYRLITESLLGLQRDGNVLRFRPRPPSSWGSYRIHYRFHDTTYHINITRQGTGASIGSLRLDGIVQPENFVPLLNDQINHEVEIDLA